MDDLERHLDELLRRAREESALEPERERAPEPVPVPGPELVPGPEPVPGPGPGPGPGPVTAAPDADRDDAEKHPLELEGVSLARHPHRRLAWYERLADDFSVEVLAMALYALVVAALIAATTLSNAKESDRVGVLAAWVLIMVGVVVSTTQRGMRYHEVLGSVGMVLGTALQITGFVTILISVYKLLGRACTHLLARARDALASM